MMYMNFRDLRIPFMVLKSRFGLSKNRRVAFTLMRQCVTGSNSKLQFPVPRSQLLAALAKLVKFISIIIHGIDFISCRIVIACVPLRFGWPKICYLLTDHSYSLG
ncbi:hypothetical protein ACLKA7_007058 [Drosophila subpalustris]